jgi:hypothetical protein
LGLFLVGGVSGNDKLGCVIYRGMADSLQEGCVWA